MRYLVIGLAAVAVTACSATGGQNYVTQADTFRTFEDVRAAWGQPDATRHDAAIWTVRPTRVEYRSINEPDGSPPVVIGGETRLGGRDTVQGCRVAFLFDDEGNITERQSDGVCQ